MPEGALAIDQRVRGAVYDAFLTRGDAISKVGIAAELSIGESLIAESFKRLADARVLVLQPASGEVLMANPFSAVPTVFQVRAASRAWWGNCIWDALGIIAMTRRDGTVETSCPDCGEALSLSVVDGGLVPAEGVAHFTVPAARWWDDIVFT